MDYVIIGNSAAAVSAVEGIRAHDSVGGITIISQEMRLAYSRPLISELLAGKISEERMWFRGIEFYRRNAVEPMLGKTAVEVAVSAKTVRLNDGTQVPYDRLLIATGARPIVLDIPGLEKDEAFTFTTWDDAVRIRSAASGAKRALVIGGGMIGLKATESLAQLGLKVTVVELANRVLSANLDEQGSDLVARRLAAAEVEVFTGTRVAEVVRDGSRYRIARLSDGRTIPFDIMVMGVGVVPNLDLAKEAGIPTARGILVNERMETGAPGVFAAGDVVEGYDSLLGTRRAIPIWPLARRQGAIAGANMAGFQAAYSGGFPMNSIELFGLAMISAGIVNTDGPDCQVMTRLDVARGIYRKVVLKDDRVVGAVSVGDIERTGILTALILDGADVRNFKDELLKDTFGYISLPKEIRKAHFAPLEVE